MTASKCETADLDENSDALQCAVGVPKATKQAHENASINADVFRGAGDASRHLQDDSLKPEGRLNMPQTNAFNAADVSQSQNMSAEPHNFDVPPALSDVSNVAQGDELQHGDAKSCVNQDGSNLSDELTQQPLDDTSDVHKELDVKDGTQLSQEVTSYVLEKLRTMDASSQHSQEKLFNNQREFDASLLALADVVRVTKHAQGNSRRDASPARQVGATRDSASPIGQSDVSKAVSDLVGATQHLQEDPANIESINNLIGRLKHLLLQERQTYAFMRQNSVSRNKLESLHNLIHYLESQVQRLEKAVHRRGLKYYVANITNKVRGHEVGRISQSMESELQSWLDQQNVREIANIISKGSQDAQVHAISSFESVVRKGYNSVLQETILSAGLVEKLARLLAPGMASWEVAKEAAFALSALIDFNKNIFVSLVLMAKTVANILSLMNREPDEHLLLLVSVIKSMLSAGHTIVVDEIHAHNGVSKFVQLLDHKLEALQHAAMDCVFELVYFGNIEVVNKMFELEVVKKLALLQQSNTTEEEHESIKCDKSAKQKRASTLISAASWVWPMLSSQIPDEDSTERNPFANAVIKFALHLSIGTGLRKREKRALKQLFLQQIKEVMEDDAEIANITAEVLWAP